MYVLLISLLNIIIINANNIKPLVSCSSCKWFIPNINNDYGRCKLFLHSQDNKPPNFPIYKFTKICREKESLCGKEGKFFENNQVNDLKKLINDYSVFINKK